MTNQDSELLCLNLDHYRVSAMFTIVHLITCIISVRMKETVAPTLIINFIYLLSFTLSHLELCVTVISIIIICYTTEYRPSRQRPRD